MSDDRKPPSRDKPADNGIAQLRGKVIQQTSKGCHGRIFIKGRECRGSQHQLSKFQVPQQRLDPPPLKARVDNKPSQEETYQKGAL